MSEGCEGFRGESGKFQELKEGQCGWKTVSRRKKWKKRRLEERQGRTKSSELTEKFGFNLNAKILVNIYKSHSVCRVQEGL